MINLWKLFENHNESIFWFGNHKKMLKSHPKRVFMITRVISLQHMLVEEKVKPFIGIVIVEVRAIMPDNLLFNFIL
jgi:hypothetical protein